MAENTVLSKFFVLVALIRAFKCSCPDEAWFQASDSCLYIADPAPNMQFQCAWKGGQLFSRPLDEELKKGIAKAMMRKAESSMTYIAYLGMGSKEDMNSAMASSQGGGSDPDWTYDGKEDKFKAGDYHFWQDEKPKDDEKCAVTGKEYDFKAKPIPCDKKLPFVCQKDDGPCYDEKTFYMEYNKMCLVLQTENAEREKARTLCDTNGLHLANLEKEDNIQSFFQLFYNTKFNGGIYVGLNKTSDGWIYTTTNEKMQDVFADDDKQEFECGGVRVLSSETVGLHTLPCSEKRMYFLCEIRTEKKSSDT